MEAAEGGAAWDPMADYRMMSRFVGAYMRLWRSPKPVIAQVHGHCVGGGTDFALCSDLIVCADECRIGYPPARVWGSPTTSMWIYRVGLERAKRLLLTGDALDGRTAVAWGLASESHPEVELEAAGLALAAEGRPAPRQPAADDEAARQPGLRADGPRARPSWWARCSTARPATRPRGSRSRAAAMRRRARRRGRARRARSATTARSSDEARAGRRRARGRAARGLRRLRRRPPRSRCARRSPNSAARPPRKDYQALCDRVFAPQLVRKLTQIGLPCEIAMQQSFENVAEPAADDRQGHGRRPTRRAPRPRSGPPRRARRPRRTPSSSCPVEDGWRISSLG